MRVKERTGTPVIADGRTEDGRHAISLAEVAGLLGLARSTVYAAAAAGDIPTIAVGGRRLVPVAALERLLAGETP